jgi:hypothetical protein
MTKPLIIGTKLANGHFRTTASTVLSVRTPYDALYTQAQVVSFILSGGFRHRETRNDSFGPGDCFVERLRGGGGSEVEVRSAVVHAGIGAQRRHRLFDLFGTLAGL